MDLRNLVAAAFLPLFAGSDFAAELQPITAQPIQLGPVSGTAYYTDEADGYRVVATLWSDEATTPIRIKAVLASGETVLLSAPRAAVEAPETVAISRVADRVVVREATLTN